MAEDVNEGYLHQQADIGIVIECLIRGGHTMNGPVLSFWAAAKQTGLDKERLFHALCYLIDGREVRGSTKAFIEEYPGGTLKSGNALARVRGRDNETRPWEVYFRLTEAGVLLAKEEISVRHQLKQLSEFDAAAKRSRRSFRLSIAAFAISATALLAGPTRLLVNRHWETPGHAMQSASSAISPSRQTDSISSIIRESVWATCGPCDADSTTASK